MRQKVAIYGVCNVKSYVIKYVDLHNRQHVEAFDFDSDEDLAKKLKDVFAKIQEECDSKFQLVFDPLLVHLVEWKLTVKVSQ